MKKVLVWVALLAMFAIAASGVASAKFASENEAVSAAYSCLVNATNKTSLSLEESIYTILALGYHNRSNATIGAEKSTSADCWPAAGCTLKRTAQVGLAHDLLLRNTTGIEKWLYTKNGTATGMDWFLEIDTDNQVPASCTLKDNIDSSENAVTIDSTQKMAGTPGTCFTFARDGYLLKINPSCMDRTFEIKCDEDFITAVLYKKTTSETYYISGDTHTSVAEGTTSERVTAKCFKNGENCDYEGTLWSALALQHFGRDVTQFIPYLIALADEEANTKLMPHAFIYMLTESDDSYNELTQSQQQGKFWRADVNNSRLYDTALGIWALAGTNAQESTKAKNYLLEIQESNGCWNSKNIRDTAFILYAGWAQPLVASGGDSRTPVTRIPGSGSNSSRTQCEQAGFSCSTAFACLDAGGTMKGEYTCSGSNECCSVTPAARLSCSAQSGIVCSSSQQCSGRTGASSSGTCCFASCIASSSSNSGDDGNECESGFYGQCKSSCAGDEYDSGFSCSTPGYLCCSASSENSSSSGGSGIWWWVILLLILCIAATLGIIYKDKVRIWWFKMTNRKQPPSSPSGSSLLPRPGTLIPRRLPPMGGFARPMPTSRPGMRAPQRPTSKPQSAKNAEYEETLKKLREMSK